MDKKEEIKTKVLEAIKDYIIRKSWRSSLWGNHHYSKSTGWTSFKTGNAYNSSLCKRQGKN